MTVLLGLLRLRTWWIQAIVIVALSVRSVTMSGLQCGPGLVHTGASSKTYVCLIRRAAKTVDYLALLTLTG